MGLRPWGPGALGCHAGGSGATLQGTGSPWSFNSMNRSTGFQIHQAPG